MTSSYCDDDRDKHFFIYYMLEVMRGREKLMKNSNERKIIHQIIIQKKLFFRCVVFAEKCAVNEENF